MKTILFIFLITIALIAGNDTFNVMVIDKTNKAFTYDNVYSFQNQDGRIIIRHYEYVGGQTLMRCVDMDSDSMECVIVNEKLIKD